MKQGEIGCAQVNPTKGSEAAFGLDSVSINFLVNKKTAHKNGIRELFSCLTILLINWFHQQLQYVVR